ncbi:HEAT repeat domain-containing protein [cf. Phormidesmis sp. LEGE 11477]|uniref:HEAT repeat domain-containing protein n=1 Tax=cf. Phormidesmis sp. LEGE 11477 TaxID=1828680 RepID=UPI00187FBC42|nr:HEAT repeat domain-containing protein [cf. Phormidesmis sp. LEGE 11477]MBE9060156.1 HEAT repeat domain-containing protein [cf. Phormidesmis sp. LEGE 11477]
MTNRFSGLFNLSEAQAIEILDGPADDSDEASSRYIAASHLVNFNTERAIASLMRAANNTSPDLDNRIVRRKAVESLGRLKVKSALPAIKACLDDDDNYLVENAAWAIGEIGTDSSATLEKLAQQLERPDQSYRTIIHTLAALGYAPAVERIRPFINSESAPIASAALSALYQLQGDESVMPKILGYLQNTNVNARRGSIQDLIDARYSKAIPNVAQCPVSMVFRLRGIKLLAAAGIEAGAIAFAQVKPWLERTLRDHPNDIALVHSYSSPPAIEELIQELYGTDFGRCYLGSKTLIENYAQTAPTALIESYEAEGYNDYGAHYHIMRLCGWLKMSEASDLLVEALHNKAPQFQKSRVAAAIALGELGNSAAIDELKTATTMPIWDLQYAAILALDQLGVSVDESEIDSTNWLVQEKLSSL